MGACGYDSGVSRLLGDANVSGREQARLASDGGAVGVVGE